MFRVALPHVPWVIFSREIRPSESCKSEERKDMRMILTWSWVDGLHVCVRWSHFRKKRLRYTWPYAWHPGMDASLDEPSGEDMARRRFYVLCNKSCPRFRSISTGSEAIDVACWIFSRSHFKSLVVFCSDATPFVPFVRLSALWVLFVLLIVLGISPDMRSGICFSQGIPMPPHFFFKSCPLIFRFCCSSFLWPNNGNHAWHAHLFLLLNKKRHGFIGHQIRV